MGIYIDAKTFYEFENTTAFREDFHALQITHIMLAGAVLDQEAYDNYNKSNVYTIKQTKELYNYYRDENGSWHTLPQRYGNFFNSDNEITYKTLDEIGAWRPQE